MKKQTRIHNAHSSAARSRRTQRRSRLSMKWMIVPAFCIAVFFGLVAIAIAVRTSGGSSAGGQDQQQAIQPAPTRQAGIVNMQQGPFLPSVFTVRNFWQGPVGSDWVLAYAGAKPNADGTAGQGGIVLYTETVNQSGGFDMHPLGTFLAPAGCPALTITAIEGNLMTVRSISGRTLTFNLQTHQFQ